MTLQTSSVLSNPDRTKTLPCVMFGAERDSMSVVHHRLGESGCTRHINKPGRDAAVNIIEDVNILRLRAIGGL